MRDCEVVLPRRVRPQPTPYLAPGGDCGACVLGGLLDLELEEVYREYGEEGKPSNFTWPGMKQALYRAQAHGAIDRFVYDVPIWPYGVSSQAMWGLPSWTMTLDWFQYITMAIDAGYYGLAVVDHARRGYKHPGDHFVLIVGIRAESEEYELKSGGRAWRVKHELLISNSSTRSTPEEWVEVQSFLENWGGYNAILARPAAGHGGPEPESE